MTLYARVRGEAGRHELDARHGRTHAELVASLTRDSLTGSAVDLDDREVTLRDGRVLRYGDLASTEAEEGFLD